MTLVSNGGQFYTPNQPDWLTLSCSGGRWKIVDAEPAAYDQARFVCRRTAESLARKYPDIYHIEFL